MSTISTPDELRNCYPQPLERSLRKSLPALDAHMRRFISRSPFLCLGTSSGGGSDVTPRGDSPGFVYVLDDRTLLIPDWPGTTGSIRSPTSSRTRASACCSSSRG